MWPADPGIRIHGAQRGDRGARRCVLVDRAAGERDVGRVLIEQVVDRDGHHFRIGVAARVGDLNRDVVRLVRFEVDVGAGCDPDLVTYDFTEA